MPRTCLFCSSTQMSREHLWPAWLASLFPEERRRHLISAGVGLDATDKTWIAKPFTSEAKVVCRTCNSGWMSKLEEDTKPILSPFIPDAAGSRRLTRYDQLVIANWTMLRLMVHTILIVRTIPASNLRNSRTRSTDNRFLIAVCG